MELSPTTTAANNYAGLATWQTPFKVAPKQCGLVEEREGEGKGMLSNLYVMSLLLSFNEDGRAALSRKRSRSY